MAAASGRTLLPVALLLSLLLLGGRRAEGADCGLCQCQETYVDCDNAELEALPTGLPDTIQVVRVRFSRIREVSAEAVGRMGSLPLVGFFAMTDGELEALAPAALRPLTNLTSVDFSRNRISHLAPDAFPLTLLSAMLSGNPLQMPADGRLLEAPELSTLYINECNLTNLPPELIRSFPELQLLEANGNSLGSLQPDTFAANRRLANVDLDRNPLQAPEEGPLLASHYVEVLKLSSTGLAQPRADLFRGLPNLRFLWLEDNGIHSLPQDFFSALRQVKFLGLAHNPLRELPPALRTPPSSLERLDLRNASLGPSPQVPLLVSDALTDLLLSANGLAELPAAALAELPQLAFLHVDGNRQLRLDIAALEAALPRLQFVWPSETASTCPCVQQDLGRWAEKHYVDLSNAQCDGNDTQPC